MHINHCIDCTLLVIETLLFTVAHQRSFDRQGWMPQEKTNTRSFTAEKFC